MKDALLRQLEANPVLLADLVRSVPPERLDRRFGDRIWTVRDHLAHLAQTQPMLAERLRFVIGDPDPVIVPFVPDAEGSGREAAPEPVEDLLTSFRKWRSRQIEIIRSAPDAVWNKPVTHPEYETYSFSILVRHILLHDGFHFYRIEDLGFLKEEHIHPL